MQAAVELFGVPTMDGRNLPTGHPCCRAYFPRVSAPLATPLHPSAGSGGGPLDRASGNVQEGFGTAKRKVKETVDDISDDED